MPKVYKVEGIVLKRVVFGEADRIVTLFTKNFGKIIVLAKGIRKISSKKAPHLELFSHIQAILTSGSIWDYIIEVQTLESYSFFRSQLDRVAYGFKIVEEIDRLCAERESHQSIFYLLTDILRKIDDKRNTDIEILIDNFSSQLLWELGYLPSGRLLRGEVLDDFFEKIMEKNLKSKSLLAKI